jgi:enoyl-CoA hydratase/carnithine racemase
MTGETIGAAEALVWGLVEKISEEKNLDQTVNSALDAILAGEPGAIRAQKRLCKLWEEAPLAESIRVSIDEFSRSYESGEPNRRVAAFRAARRSKA